MDKLPLLEYQSLKRDQGCFLKTLVFSSNPPVIFFYHAFDIFYIFVKSIFSLFAILPNTICENYVIILNTVTKKAPYMPYVITKRYCSSNTFFSYEIGTKLN